MKVYIGWVIELETGKTIFNQTKKLIAAGDATVAENLLIEQAREKKEIILGRHHPVVLEIARIPTAGLAG